MPGMQETMREFKAGKLRSGPKKGPKVTSHKQAIAIGLSEARKAGKRVAPKPESDDHFAERRARRVHGM